MLVYLVTMQWSNAMGNTINCELGLACHLTDRAWAPNPLENSLNGRRVSEIEIGKVREDIS